MKSERGTWEFFCEAVQIRLKVDLDDWMVLRALYERHIREAYDRGIAKGADEVQRIRATLRGL